MTSSPSRNPLTGLCGLQLEVPRWKTHRRGNQVAIPLRGYVVCNKFYALNPEEEEWGRNPLTGLCGLQPADLRVAGGGERHEVAIPLRGYVVCNDIYYGPSYSFEQKQSQSPYGAMWFAT